MNARPQTFSQVLTQIALISAVAVACSSVAAEDARLTALRTVFPEMTQLYSKQFGRPILQCSADAHGQLLVVMGGRGPTTLAAFDTSGAERWRRDLNATFDGPSVDCFVQGANGTVLVITGIDEERAEYVVLNPEGGEILKEVIEGDDAWMLALSPSGRYYYRTFQEGRFIHLMSTFREPDLVLDLQSLLPQFSSASIQVNLIDGDRVVLTQRFQKGYQRCALLSVTSDTPEVLEIWEGDNRQPAPWLRRWYGKGGGYWQTTGMEVARFDSNERQVWTKRFPLSQCIVMCDEQFVGVFANDLHVLEAASGREAGVIQASPGLFAVKDWVCSGGHLVASGIDGTGARLIALVAKVSETGLVSAESIRDMSVSGLEPSRPVIGVAVHASSDSSVVVAFRK